MNREPDKQQGQQSIGVQSLPTARLLLALGIDALLTLFLAWWIVIEGILSCLVIPLLPLVLILAVRLSYHWRNLTGLNQIRRSSKLGKARLLSRKRQYWYAPFLAWHFAKVSYEADGQQLTAEIPVPKRVYERAAKGRILPLIYATEKMRIAMLDAADDRIRSLSPPRRLRPTMWFWIPLGLLSLILILYLWPLTDRGQGILFGSAIAILGTGVIILGANAALKSAFMSRSSLAEAEVLRKDRVQQAGGEYGSYSVYYIVVEFEADGRLEFLELRVNERLYNKLTRGSMLKIRYARANPRIAVLEYEPAWFGAPRRKLSDTVRSSRRSERSRPEPSMPVEALIKELIARGFKASSRSARIYYNPAAPSVRLVRKKRVLRIEANDETWGRPWRRMDSFSLRNETDLAFREIDRILARIASNELL